MKQKTRIETVQTAYIINYPQAIEFSIKQMAVLWTAEELGVEKDANDVRMQFTPSERHALMTLQSILTQYELMIGGDELWGDKICKLFPVPEIERMCRTFSFFELGIHAPFYDLMNKALNIATTDFYLKWKQDPILAEKIAYTSNLAASDDALMVTAALAFLEGVSLFSAFAFFKSFNRGGYNLIPHFVAGIDASAKDENFHSQASGWLFKTCLAERKEAGIYTKENKIKLKEALKQMAEDIYEHELRIIDKIFELGDIRPITKEQLIDFIEDRVNVVLKYLGQPVMFKKHKGEVSKWFYGQLSTFKYSDFFATSQTQYVRSWDVNKLRFIHE